MEQECPVIVGQNTKVIDLGNLEDVELIQLEDETVPPLKRDNYHHRVSGYWLKRGNKIYYFKVPIFERQILKELVGEKITLYFGLPSVHYQLAKMKIEDQTVYGLLSQYTRQKDKEYMLLKDWAVKEGWEQQNFLRFLNEGYGDQPLLEEYKKLLVRELYTQEEDRQDDEIIVEIDQGKVRLSPLVDYEEEFILRGKLDPIKIPCIQTFDIENISTLLTVKADKNFEHYFNQVKKLKINKLLTELKGEFNLRLHPIDRKYYLDYDAGIKKHLKKYNLF